MHQQVGWGTPRAILPSKRQSRHGRKRQICLETLKGWQRWHRRLVLWSVWFYEAAFQGRNLEDLELSWPEMPALAWFQRICTSLKQSGERTTAKQPQSVLWRSLASNQVHVGLCFFSWLLPMKDASTKEDTGT